MFAAVNMTYLTRFLLEKLCWWSTRLNFGSAHGSTRRPVNFATLQADTATLRQVVEVEIMWSVQYGLGNNTVLNNRIE
jgi:hypothetical protein